MAEGKSFDVQKAGSHCLERPFVQVFEEPAGTAAPGSLRNPLELLTTGVSLL